MYWMVCMYDGLVKYSLLITDYHLPKNKQSPLLWFWLPFFGPWSWSFSIPITIPSSFSGSASVSAIVFWTVHSFPWSASSVSVPSSIPVPWSAAPSSLSWPTTTPFACLFRIIPIFSVSSFLQSGPTSFCLFLHNFLVDEEWPQGKEELSNNQVL